MQPRALPDLVDDLLTAIAQHRFNVNQLGKWHGQFDAAGGHLCDGAITAAEGLHLDTLLMDVANSDRRLTAATVAFEAARAAAKLHSQNKR
jgi:hypothetical protein